MNHPNRDWKLPLPSLFFEEGSREPEPLPTPPEAPRAFQVVRTPTELTNPPPASHAPELAAPAAAVTRRADLFRWVVLVALLVTNMLVTLSALARR
jgi:hypothetical protein